jgi:hypothetical protein
MNVYADILSSVLNDWVDELSGDALVEFTRLCRVQMVDSSPTRDGASTALAAELSYDRALIKVCQAHGIEVMPMRFSHPSDERARLEGELVAMDIDLRASSRSRAQD